MSRLVTIERKKLDPNRLYGVIVGQSPNLTLLHHVYDFQFDGFLTMRTGDITSCNSSEADDYCRKLMRREGLWKTVPRWVKTLSIEAWPELLGDLVGKVVILEDEVRDSFHIGPLIEARARHAAIHYFDARGRPQDVEKVPYSRITLVSFGDRYSTIHAKYLTFGEKPSSSKDRRSGRPSRQRVIEE